MKSKKGFTLYELLVIVGIMSILTSIVFAYTRKSEGQIALFRDRAAITAAVLRAKATAVQTFRDNPASGPVCGYGVHLEEKKVILFRELPVASGAGGTLACGPADFYSGRNEDIDTYTLDPRVALSLCGDDGTRCAPIGTGQSAALDILFIPPEPRVLFSPNDPSWSEFRITPALLDGTSRTSDIVVNRAGQVAVGL